MIQDAGRTRLKSVSLGQTGVTVTRLGLGLAPIAGLYTAVGDEAARATIEAAWEAGVRFFDTAPLYGHGLSERRAGAVLSSKPRSSYTLSTKVGRRLRASSSAPRDIWGEDLDNAVYWDFSGEGAVRSLEESLDRLGLDRVDLLHIHDPDNHYAEAVAGALPALAELRSEGRVGAISVGMNQAPMLADFVRTGMVDCVLLAGRYTLLDQRGLDELLPLCADRGVSVIGAGVFNSGILAGGSTFDYGPAPDAVRVRVEAIRAVCDRHGVPLRAAAVQFPLRHPVIAAILLGLRSPAEVSDAVAVLVEAARCSSDETYEFLAVAEATPEIAGVVGWASLTDPVLRDTIEGYRAAPGGPLLVGIRDQVQGRADDYLMEPAVHAGLRTIADLGLVNELVVTESQLPSVVFAASSVASTFVLDHLGKPHSFETWRASAAQLAALPNVVAKLSGLVTEVDDIRRVRAGGRRTVRDRTAHVRLGLAGLRAGFVLCGRQGPARGGAGRPAHTDLRRHRDRHLRPGAHHLKCAYPNREIWLP